MPDDIIKVAGLCKSFGKLEVLKDISFTVNRGEVVAVIGPSGSGKSTLLRCITHLEEVNEGSISLDGRDMVKDGVYAQAHVIRGICLKMGLVFQNFNLFPHFSVERNITEAQVHVLRRSKAEAAKRARLVSGRKPCLKKWGFPTRPAPTLSSFPAASSSGSP